MGQTGVIKLQILCFWLLSCLLLLEVVNVLGGHGKSYAGILESLLYLLPSPTLMGQTGVIKSKMLSWMAAGTRPTQGKRA